MSPYHGLQDAVASQAKMAGWGVRSLESRTVLETRFQESTTYILRQ